MRTRVAIVSLIATWVFFHRYLPPLKQVHLFADIQGYHYPLFVYAHKSLREGRIPQWDPTIYSGMPFAGNAQVGLFYPPNWLVFAANATRNGVLFWTVEALEMLHLWIAFNLCWMWLAARARSQIAALLGAAAFGFAGYAVAEAQHLGVICGLAWFPLGLWGIDERKPWKTALASALCLLAGYPPTWFAFAVTCGVYALATGGWRSALKTVMAVGYSLLIAMVQLAPSIEAASLKLREKVYGGGIPGAPFIYLQFVMPNYYDQSHRVARLGTEQETYFYWSAPVLLGLGWLLVHRKWRLLWPAAAIAGAGLLFIHNPLRILERIVDSLPFISEICRDWNFLAAITVAGVLAGATGLALIEPGRVPPWISLPMAAFWILRMLLTRHHAKGWWTLAEVAATVLVIYLLLRTPRNALATAALLLMAFTELFAYGSNRRFNSVPGSPDSDFATDARVGGTEFIGIDQLVYDAIRPNVDYRIVIDQSPYGTDTRFYGLTTPSGFDPFLPVQYRKAVEQYVPFVSNRLFHFDLSNKAMFDAFAVRYVFTGPESEARKRLSADPRFRRMEPSESFYHVFEYLDAKPTFRYESGTASRASWSAERRLYKVRSETGGPFLLLEQYFPGWEARIDDTPATIHRAQTAFQSIEVPKGDHWIEFRYRSKALRFGAWISLLALSAGAFAVLRGSAASRGNTR